MIYGLIVDMLQITNFLNNTDMIFTLPPLPYAMDALEPFMSMETLEYHHGKHLQTYVDNLNRLIKGTPYEDMPLEDIILSATGSVFNNAAQVWNHTFFFDSLTPDPAAMPKDLEKAIVRDFGSVEDFEEKFKAAAVGVFGSGWAWLAQDKDGSLHIIQESNAGNPLRAGYKPLLTIDVWEHAYYIDYRNRRAEFVNKCWNLIDWKKVSSRMHKPAKEAAAKDLSRYVCITCGWVYDPVEGDPESGVAPGTPFEDIPEEWLCPACGIGKEMFEKER